jgi:3-oxoadipate enol-lactonase
MAPVALRYPRMGTARVNGINLYYEEHGEGEPLLWVGGLGANVREIPHLIRSYSRWSRFICFDARGCGRSDKPPDEYSIAGLADDAAALLDHLGVASALVYGSSMGGMVAQELALLHPTKVRALVLGCTTGGAARGSRPSPETVRRIAANQSLTGDAALEAGWRLGYSDGFIERNRDALLAMARDAARFAAPRDSYMRQVIAAAKHDAWERLHLIACPVLIIHGADDVMVPVENAYLLKRHIPHAELQVLPGAGHGYNLEAQELADRLVMDFFRRHGVAAMGEAHFVR